MEQESTKKSLLLCPFSMALSYNTGNIYTADSCIKLLKSSKIDGSNQEVIIPNIGSCFVYRSSLFGDGLFWSQASSVSVVKYFNIKMGTSHEIFQRSMNIFYDVMVVHSSNQPPGIITTMLLAKSHSVSRYLFTMTSPILLYKGQCWSNLVCLS